MSEENFKRLEIQERHVQGHGLYRFLELYSERHDHRRGILSLPVVGLLRNESSADLVQHLLDVNLPVTALLPFEAMIKVCLGHKDVKPTKFLGQVMTTMLVAMYGFNELAVALDLPHLP